MGMTDREKVIKRLEEVIAEAVYPVRPRGFMFPLLLAEKVLELLKAQEPRLVEPTDFEKADDYNWLPAWCEESTGGTGYYEMILPSALDEKDVRYWTCRPTREQMEATPWERLN